MVPKGPPFPFHLRTADQPSQVPTWQLTIHREGERARPMANFPQLLYEEISTGLLTLLKEESFLIESSELAVLSSEIEIPSRMMWGKPGGNVTGHHCGCRISSVEVL